VCGLRVAVFLLLLNIIIQSSAVSAGPLVSLGVHWNNFAFEPLDEGDPVANFYGAGGELNLGYTMARIFSLSTWGSYTPSSMKNVEVGREDAVLWAYGGKLGFNIWKSVFFNLHAGQYTYGLIFNERPTELDGRWAGPGGGLAMGGIFPGKNKAGFWTLGVEFTRSLMKKMKVEDESDDSTRKLDVFAVSLSYVFTGNSRGSSFNFLKSIF